MPETEVPPSPVRRRLPPDARRLLRTIDDELCAHRQIMRGALAELAEVRRRRAELIDMESALVVALEARVRRIDDLLDDRLAVEGEAGGPPSLPRRRDPRPDAVR
ncbi:hypothetical protein [Blastococcus sp. SYSU DS0617]